ncbi:unnamed protein product [Dovyalis caffra]|uniref:PGG domain-containing protein n=1 Tax=Dovyalis caffra TaxID=77055 RepID=A0AAV1SIV7_9ROSI|nr:unnamed protein product [Dovyalis caffra]
MKKVLYEFAKANDIDSFIDAFQQVSSTKQLNLFAIFEHVTPSGNSVLNKATSFGSQDNTELLSHHFPFLITRKNFRGDIVEKSPLYLAVENKNEKILALLLEATPGGDSLNRPVGKSPAHDRRVKDDIANNENLTSYDVAWGQSEKAEEDRQPTIAKPTDLYRQDKSINSKPVNHERTQPQAVDSKESKQLDYYELMMTLSIFYWCTKPVKPLDKFLPIHGKPLSKEEMKSRIGSLLVGAVLVAGVTFAGAIQLPQLGDNGAKYKIWLNVYMYSDILALNVSTFAALILYGAQLNEIKLAPAAVWFASVLVGASIYLMCLAFYFAAFIAARGSLPFLVTVCLIVVGFLIIHSFFYIQWFIPLAVNQAVQRFISIYFYFSMFAGNYNFEMLVSKVKDLNKLEE